MLPYLKILKISSPFLVGLFFLALFLFVAPTKTSAQTATVVFSFDGGQCYPNAPGYTVPNIHTSFRITSPGPERVYVYRNDNFSIGNFDASTVSTINISDSNIETGKSYYYILRTAGGRVLATSSPVTVTTHCAPPSPSFTQINASCNGNSANVNLFFSPQSASPPPPPIQYYWIWRDGSKLTTTTSTNPYTNTGVGSNENHTYEISAVSTYGDESARSTSRSITTPNCIPTPPTVSLNPLSTSCNGTTPQINLSWTYANANNVTIIKNDLSIGGVVATSYTDNAVANSALYTYYLIANGAGGSTNSNTQQITTPNCAPTPPANNAQCLGYIIPTTPVSPGQQFNASVYMRNTGTKQWNSDATPHSLGRDDWMWGIPRVSTTPINPGQDAGFHFTATAPGSVGDYPFVWRMVEDGVEWFGDQCGATIQVRINPPSRPVIFPPIASCNSTTSTVSFNLQEASYTQYYDIYRWIDTNGDGNPENAALVATINGSNFNSGVYTYNDTSVTGGNYYDYYAVARNNYGQSPSINNTSTPDDLGYNQFGGMHSGWRRALACGSPTPFTLSVTSSCQSEGVPLMTANFTKSTNANLYNIQLYDPTANLWYAPSFSDTSLFPGGATTTSFTPTSPPAMTIVPGRTYMYRVAAYNTNMPNSSPNRVIWSNIATPGDPPNGWPWVERQANYCDNTPPQVSMNNLFGCFDSTSWNALQPLTATVSDNSGISSVAFRLTNLSNNTTANINATPVGANSYQASIPTSSLIAGASYRILAQATDLVGLSTSSPSYSFNYQTSCSNNAWFQTTGGDVHSNRIIDTPGGP